VSLVNLLSIGPGTFGYHLLVLLVLEVIVGIVFIEWRHTRNPDHHRALWAFVGLLALRAMLLLSELFGPAIIAPLTSGVEVASLVLLGWAFLAPLLNHRIRKGYLIGGLGATILCVVVFLPGWYRALVRIPNRLYVAFWQQIFWYAVSMPLALAPALIPLRLQRRERQRLSMSGFAMLFLGFATLCVGSLLLTVDWFESDILSHTLIGVGRLINLLGYPLFAVAVCRIALQGTWAYREELQDVSEETLYQTQELLSLLEASRTIGESLDLATILRRAVESVATALDADRCVIFLVNPSDGNGPGTVNLAAQYGSFQCAEQPAVRQTFPLTEQPTLAYALKRHRQLIINAETNDSRLRALYRLLGSQDTGPIIVQPLFHHRRILGGLVVGNDRSQRAFVPSEGRLCRSIAVQISAAIENARLYHDLEAQIGQLAESLRFQEDEICRGTAILESIAEGVVVSDREGHIVMANAAAGRILGIPRQHIVGCSPERLMSYMPLALKANWSTVAQSDISLETVFELENRVVYVNAAPILTSAGDRLGIVAILRDITGETRAERSRYELITAVSHELRTSLTAIRGYAEALSSGMVGAVREAQVYFLRIIRDNALRMASLTENLVAVSQIEKGFLKLKYGETDLRLLINDVVRSFQSQLEARQLEISLEFDDGLPLIEADPARVRQVLDNLVSNAIKFTYPGGHITIDAKIVNDSKGHPPTHCSIWVSDTGIGISPENQLHIWERFYRSANPLAAKASRLNVGLSIVKSLVEAHSGRVWVESTPGVGSTFIVLLPIEREAAGRLVSW